MAIFLSKNMKKASLLSLLVFSILLTSCSKTSKKNHAIAKINELTYIEQKLIETFKQQFKPEQGQIFEENFAEIKRVRGYNIAAWNTEINELEALKKEFSQSHDGEGDLGNVINTISFFKQLIPNLEIVDIELSAGKVILRLYLAILYNLKEQSELHRKIKE